ncbi:MAG: hypothetical protein ACRDXX_07120 [Stackebrandtia sp.]
MTQRSHQPPPPPHVDPKELKPGRFWYLVAALIMVVGVGGGVGLSVFGIVHIASGMPDMKAEFASGETVSVTLSAEKDWAIFVDYPDNAQPFSTECTVTPVGGGEADVSEPGGAFTYGTNERNWQLVYDVSVSETGEYEITCALAGDDYDTDFAVGDSVDVGAFIGQTFGSIAALLCLPAAALIVGGVIIVVVGMKRAAHKKRLWRQAAGWLTAAPRAAE